MPFARSLQLPGLAAPVSPLAIGFFEIPTFDALAPMLDAFWEAGGNLFDTAWVYGGGISDRLLGEWLAARGTRAEAVVIGKGAHTPECVPEAIGRQLTESLERMGTDHLDVYVMHRDNPDVPAGEFVDAIDAEVRAGRIRGPYGGSNWSMERMDAAIAHAAANGRQAPQVLSNQCSLAEMIEPMWPGCVSCSESAFRDWLVARGIANLAWSSQARGFFTDRSAPERRDDADFVRVWYSDTNFTRKARAAELAARHGVGAQHVALAYVAAQPYASVPIIGPHTLDELHDSLRGVGLTLAAADVAWLADGTR